MLDAFVKNLHRGEKILTRLLEGIVTVFFFIILVITVLFVVLRYGFNESIIGGDEAMEYLFIYTTAIGAAISLAHREHIKIDVLVERFPVILRKIVNSIGLLLVAFFNGVLIWLGLPWIKAVGSFESPVLRIPNRFIQMSVPIGCGLAIVYCCYHVLLNIFEKNPDRVTRQ
jgi:TRAP-type C4-dicarboxylate transport system permease small subunit